MSNPQISNDSDTAEIRFSLELARALQSGFSTVQCLQNVLVPLLSGLGVDAGGTFTGRAGHWRNDFWFQSPDASEPAKLAKRSVPDDLFAEALDSERTKFANRWCVTPLPGGTETTFDGFPANASALVLRMTDTETSASRNSQRRRDRISHVAELLAAALSRIDTDVQQKRRIEQLTAVLRAAATWPGIDDQIKLLHEIAGVATDLLGCERASIFLWDKRRKKLIGRPALGTQDDSLEVDDNVGIVGEVLDSGMPQVWNRFEDDRARLNAAIDRSLEFETRSLVAVPLLGGRDQLIGVFEAINKVAPGDEKDQALGFDAADAALLGDLALHAAVAIEASGERRRLTRSRDRLIEDAASNAKLIGEHPTIAELRGQITRVAPTDLSVMILGQNGTGKEVLARNIHFDSKRRDGPFIAINCAALVESLLESELFGHERGAFTDAKQSRPGKFELASGGTLFLDEIGDMSPGGQAKLLRVLEEKVVVRVGGSQPIAVDVRIIAATNQPLEHLIAEKRFREDLYFRLNVVSLHLPPLCERGEDILLLSDYFLEQFCLQIGRTVPRFDASARSAMLSHAWPGNIRQLRNTIERVCYLTSDSTVTAEDLMLTPRPGGGSAVATEMPDQLTEATRLFQTQQIQRSIQRCGGNMTDAAAKLGLHRSNLYRKMRQLGMPTGGE